MNTFVKSLALGLVAATISASSAFAGTTWKNFEYGEYDVKARYQHGELRAITAVNEVTGAVYKGRITPTGIAYIKQVGSEDVRVIDIVEAEKRYDARTTLQDIAEAQ